VSSLKVLVRWNKKKKQGGVALRPAEFIIIIIIIIIIAVGNVKVYCSEYSQASGQGRLEKK